MSATDIGNQFVKFYYDTFDNNRAGLSPLYMANSTLTFEQATVQGQQAIIEKFNTLPKTQHKTDTIDIQPSLNESSILIFVTGKMIIDSNPPLQFTQVFQLVAHQPGQFYVHNDIFRLIYG
ncbi:unnamed protein product [Aphanomyces euteiches]|uniref:Nuclear transport factor 2 n=1 Tax=Aphanomyces euteiches TaxID=100861 RepID=A0A6G0XJI3_9STRA|nr:hypothetical protein Ae201684_004282 [Aphanomyces euteiches]KAH9094070.1 hypothetical protein Ae201684P_016686 [Aphanomyces euteiches]KAH9102339.1 hypothetical protein LEN26_015556 [Aphanomyces euteiches]KAH9125482.1 hypothetical protein AeMF1_003913 [Aphanomyces euteiches]KAH9136382.1 hypothetical protein AeRB84_018454 [Aphanomyces euteiches]